jgi:hypothetical protein
MRPFRLFRTVSPGADPNGLPARPDKGSRGCDSHKPEKSGKLRRRTGLEDGIRRDLIRFDMVTKNASISKGKAGQRSTCYVKVET